MAKKGKVTVVLSLVDKKFKRGLSKAGASIKKFGKVAAVGTGVATVAFAIMTKKAIKASNEQIAAEQKLLATLAATTGATREDTLALFEQAAALQRVTRFGDEVTIMAQQQMAVFGMSISAIKELTPHILNMAEANIDLRTGAKLVGQAMTGEMGMLRRYGIVFDEETKKIIKFGTETEKVAAITEALEGKFGGLAETMGETFAGAVSLAKNNLGDVFETMGKVVTQSGVLREAALIVAESIGTMASQSDKDIKELHKTIKKWTVNTVLFFTTTASAAATLTGYLTQMARAAIIAFEVSTLGTATIASKVYGMAAGTEGPLDAIKGRLDGIGGAALDTANDIDKAGLRIASRLAKANITVSAGVFGGGRLSSLTPTDGGGGGGKVLQMDEYRDSINETTQALQGLRQAEFEMAMGAQEETENYQAKVIEFSDFWVGQMTTMGDVTRNTIGAAVSGVGQGIAENLVEGTADWETVGKNVLKTFIAMTAQLLLMLPIVLLIRSAMAAISFGTSEAAGAASTGFFSLFGKKGGLAKDLPSFATGGYTGGSSYNQPMPAMLHGNEMVVNAAGTRRNRSVLDAINSGAKIGQGGSQAVDQSFHQPLHFYIQAIDAADLDEVIVNKIIPKIENESKGRRTQIVVNA